MSYGTTQTNQHSHDIKLCSDIWQSCQDIKLVFYNRELNKIVDSVARTRDDKLKEKSSKNKPTFGTTAKNKSFL